jgi:hypothetical protein
MDFIERIFGVSPDGGTGAFEFMLFVLRLSASTFCISTIPDPPGGSADAQM